MSNILIKSNRHTNELKIVDLQCVKDAWIVDIAGLINAKAPKWVFSALNDDILCFRFPLRSKIPALYDNNDKRLKDGDLFIRDHEGVYDVYRSSVSENSDVYKYNEEFVVIRE